MATLRDIKKRIVSVQSTRQITRTMEMVSTARIKKAQERIENARPYAMSISEVLGNVVASLGTSATHPLLEVREERKVVCIIAITSDRGLAGAFNSNIIRIAERALRDAQERGAEARLVTVGKKALGYFRYRGIEPVLSYRDISDRPSMENAREIADFVREAYIAGEIDEVQIAFNHFRNIADQKPEVHQLLPVEQRAIEDAEADAEAHGAPAEYVFEPSPEAVLSRLLPTYVEALTYRALLESAASEHGARRTAMKSATDNASDMITSLSRRYNRARQAAITTEIAEIVGGAAALEDKG
jgi:F-type H+-transporting ATPase subunit gamma